MKKQLPGFITGFLSAALIFGFTFSGKALITGKTAIEVYPISIMVNGEMFHPKNAKGELVDVFAYNGTTYAPVRALAEAYGLEVGYDQEKNLATVNKGTQSDWFPHHYLDVAGIEITGSIHLINRGLDNSDSLSLKDAIAISQARLNIAKTNLMWLTEYAFDSRYYDVYDEASYIASCCGVLATGKNNITWDSMTYKDYCLSMANLSEQFILSYSKILTMLQNHGVIMPSEFPTDWSQQ